MAIEILSDRFRAHWFADEVLRSQILRRLIDARTKLPDLDQEDTLYGCKCTLWTKYFSAFSGLDDPASIPFLASFLDDERIVVSLQAALSDTRPYHSIRHPPALRTRDLAHDAIDEILGEPSYWTTYNARELKRGERMRKKGKRRPPFDRSNYQASLFELRDRAIKQQERRLKRLGIQPLLQARDRTDRQ